MNSTWSPIRFYEPRFFERPEASYERELLAETVGDLVESLMFRPNGQGPHSIGACDFEQEACVVLNSITNWG